MFLSFGDEIQQNQLESILDGTTQLKVGYINNEGYTKTTGGIRTVNLGTLGTDDSLDSRLKAGVVLGHEAYRDGYTNVGNYETAQAEKDNYLIENNHAMDGEIRKMRKNANLVAFFKIPKSQGRLLGIKWH